MALRRARTSSRCFSFARCAFSCRLRSREVEYEEEGESLTGRLEAAVDEAPAAAASPSRAALSRYTVRLGASSSMSLLMRSMASVRILQVKRHDANRTEERERGVHAFEEFVAREGSRECLLGHGSEGFESDAECVLTAWRDGGFAQRSPHETTADLAG